jgi:hypothetical protein
MAADGDAGAAQVADGVMDGALRIVLGRGRARHRHRTEAAQGWQGDVGIEMRLPEQAG